MWHIYFKVLNEVNGGTKNTLSFDFTLCQGCQYLVTMRHIWANNTCNNLPHITPQLLSYIKTDYFKT